MRISAFTQIIVTVAVTAWVFILPVKAVATILVFELALLLSIKRDRMTMAASAIVTVSTTRRVEPSGTSRSASGSRLSSESFSGRSFSSPWMTTMSPVDARIPVQTAAPLPRLRG